MFRPKSILLALILILIISFSCKKDDNPVTPPSATVTDIEGNVYHTVKIGSQTWMVENLKVTKFNDGTAIPLVTDNNAWINSTTPGFCYYNNDGAKYKATYGALYNWYAVHTGKLAPAGWHVPTDAEWKTLEMSLGMTQVQVDSTGRRRTDVGGKMKETGTAHWITPNAGATNSSGCTALPGGQRSLKGTFSSFGYGGYWWSSTEYDSIPAWYRSLNYGNPDVYRSPDNKSYGYSVRCVKD